MANNRNSSFVSSSSSMNSVVADDGDDDMAMAAAAAAAVAAANQQYHRRDSRDDDDDDGFVGGEEIEIDHPDDPMRILCRDGSGSIRSSIGRSIGRRMSSIRSDPPPPSPPPPRRSTLGHYCSSQQQQQKLRLERRVSFGSSPVAATSGGSGDDDEDAATAAAVVPMVKIINTSRGDLNGRYGYVHAYYRRRERYAVTLLGGGYGGGGGRGGGSSSGGEQSGGGGAHPALVYFGVLGAEDVKQQKRHHAKKKKRAIDVDNNNPNKTERGGGGEGGGQPPQAAAQDDDVVHNRRFGVRDQQTLFLPPTTLVRLGTLDVVSLFLQYVALHLLGMPVLANRIDRAMDVLQRKILPPLMPENFSFFLLTILPVTVASLWGGEATSASLPLALSSSWSTPGLSEAFAAARYGITSLTPVPPNVVDYVYTHMGEAFTSTLLLVGTSTIARFIISEYRLVKDKAEAMMSVADGDGDGAPRRIVKTFTTLEMFEYRIDYYFSTSKWAKVALLLSFTFMLIAVGAGLLAVSMEDHSLSQAVWVSWTYVADPGTHADCPESFFVRLISFTVTLGGMLIFALMIGIISDYIAEKVDDLKKGKSQIIDIDHTVMLGWNDKSLAIIQQIALANESEGGGTIVVLATKDKEEMEETLASAIATSENPLRLLGTQVIFRSGIPLLEAELRRVSTQTARCVVSLSSEELDPDEADATQVRQVMALKAFDEFVGSKAHVVVEVQDIDNQELFALVAPDFAEVVVTHDIIGRLMIQCARCPSLAGVLEAMMGFDGSEFYFEEWPELTGMSFYDITCRFDDAVPIGIKAVSDGHVYINPENDMIVKEGDKILVLAEDNDSYEVNDGDYDIKSIGDVPPLLIVTKKVERIMFCGWRRDLADMIKQLDDYVEKGSELWLFNLVPAKERAHLLQDKGNKEELELNNLSLRNVVGNPVIRRDLNHIKAVDEEGKLTGETITLDQLDSIMILADAVAIENGANMMSCDSRSLSSLLIIQDIQKKLYQERKAIDPDTKPPCSPISEILDSRTKSLLAVANCKGYIMSNQIISSVMAQVSEEKDINTVLREILTAEGSETYLRSVSRFMDLEKENVFSFWDIALRARQLREVAVGYKPEGMELSEAEDLIINPPDKSMKRKWAPGDIIVTFSMD